MTALNHRLRALIALSPLVLGLLQPASALADPNTLAQPGDPRLLRPLVQPGRPPLQPIGVTPQPSSGDCAHPGPNVQCSTGTHPNTIAPGAVAGPLRPTINPGIPVSTQKIATCQRSCPRNSGNTCTICLDATAYRNLQGAVPPRH